MDHGTPMTRNLLRTTILQTLEAEEAYTARVSLRTIIIPTQLLGIHLFIQLYIHHPTHSHPPAPSSPLPHKVSPSSHSPPEPARSKSPWRDARQGWPPRRGRAWRARQ